MGRNLNQGLNTGLDEKTANRDLKTAVIVPGCSRLLLSAAFFGEAIKVTGIDTAPERVKSECKARTLVDTRNAAGRMKIERKRKPSEIGKR